MKVLRTWPRNFWRWIRQVSGDAAYENYLRSTHRLAQAQMAGVAARALPAARSATHATSAPLLTRREFYLDALRRRYSTVSRCC